MLTSVSQTKNLRTLLKRNASTSLFKHLGIENLYKISEFNELYAEFKTQTPVFSYQSFIRYLQQMTGQTTASPETFWTQPHVVTPKGTTTLFESELGPCPAPPNFIDAVSSMEKNFFQRTELEKQFAPGVPKNMHVFEGLTPHPSPQGHPAILNAHTHYAAHRSWPWKRHFAPPSQSIVRMPYSSNYQNIHTLIGLLEKHPETRILVTSPRTLCELGLILAQRAGKITHIKELCPKLHTIVYYAEALSFYRHQIDQLTSGLHIRFLETQISPLGYAAFQDNPHIQGWLTLSDALGVFYEFIPEDHLEPSGRLIRGYKRLHAGEVTADKRYLLMLSHAGGLLSCHINQIVQVVSTDPLRIQFAHHVEHLNHLRERLSTGTVEKVFSELNDRLHGDNLIIREVIGGDDLQRAIPVWVVEINQPIENISEKALKRVANTLHTELCLESRSYKNAFETAGQLLELHAVPLGTFSSMPAPLVPRNKYQGTAPSCALPRFDFTEDLEHIHAVLTHAGTYKTVQADLGK